MIDSCTRYISRFYVKGNNRHIDMICLERANIALVGRIALPTQLCWIVLEFFRSTDSM